MPKIRLWRDDLDTVRDLVRGNPSLLHEDVVCRAIVQGRSQTVRLIRRRAGEPPIERSSLAGPPTR